MPPAVLYHKKLRQRCDRVIITGQTDGQTDRQLTQNTLGCGKHCPTHLLTYIAPTTNLCLPHPPTSVCPTHQPMLAPPTNLCLPLPPTSVCPSHLPMPSQALLQKVLQSHPHIRANTECKRDSHLRGTAPQHTTHCSGATCLRQLKAHVLPASKTCGCEQFISPLGEEQVLSGGEERGGEGKTHSIVRCTPSSLYQLPSPSAPGMKVIRHAGVDSRMIILDNQARQ